MICISCMYMAKVDGNVIPKCSSTHESCDMPPFESYISLYTYMNIYIYILFMYIYIY